MPLSWNEIRHNAIRFASDWTGEKRECAEKQTFWNEFFEVFGVKRRVVASFEEPVRKISGKYGYIDLFWRRTLLVEHKSLGQDLGNAGSQAFLYIQDLVNEGRAYEAPRYVIVSDFARIALHDLEPDEQRGLPLFDVRRIATIEFPIGELHANIHHFAFIPGYKQQQLREQDPVNIEAAEIMGELHDALKAGGYSGHMLERFLVRILFCLFAEDTGLFDRESFRLYVDNRTAPDGSDLGLHLARLFDVLNTPTDKRQTNLDEDLAAFPYVNGALFAEHLGFADFNRDMRDALLACTTKNWSRISPAIFGSLFQSVMEPKERRQVGGHYTSESDILKVIRSLFLDDLRNELVAIKADRSTRRVVRLQEFHAKLCHLRFLDPACGCGNFLVITYRELRELELATLLALLGTQRELTLDEVNRLSQVDVDQFYGIELAEWPARIAEVALWLMDHQMNLKVSEAFGQLYQRLPLKKSPTIRECNALSLDWRDLLTPTDNVLVLGNPPFVGKKEQNPAQKTDMELIWGPLKGAGNLDYVTCWYRRAADYIQGTRIRCSFVSTNSICQGEQVGVLWNDLFGRRQIKILFAHRTFPWMSEARGKAHVHVVIIGFAAFDRKEKAIYEYHDPKAPPTVTPATNINPYLIEGTDTTIRTRTRPINGAPPINYGSMMIDKARDAGDDAGLVLTLADRNAMLAECPELTPFVREIFGGEEFLNGTVRWCLWLVDAPPELLCRSPLLRARIEKVRAFRQASARPQTQRLAAVPTLFGEIRQPTSRYLLIPKVSSESRHYIPIGFLEPDVIASGSALIIPRASLYDFGILSSTMHNAWTRTVAGRMKSDYQYSSNIVYNNFPWPPAPTGTQKAKVQEAAQAVLDARSSHSNSTLAVLYDPLSMPAALVKAHGALDRAVDRCYRPERYTSERQRVEYLFAEYERILVPIVAAGTKSTRPRRVVRSK